MTDHPASPAPLSWREGPPPLDKPGRWLFETEGFLPGTAAPYAVTVTNDLEITCACSGVGHAGRAAFIRTRAVRHFGPIPDPPAAPASP